MNKTTKVLLSVIGIAAVVVPAVLLLVLTPKFKTASKPPDSNRSIDQSVIEDVVNNNPLPTTFVYPTPTTKPASPSARPTAEGSPSAQ